MPERGSGSTAALAGPRAVGRRPQLTDYLGAGASAAAHLVAGRADVVVGDLAPAGLGIRVEEHVQLTAAEAVAPELRLLLAALHGRLAEQALEAVLLHAEQAHLPRQGGHAQRDRTLPRAPPPP